MDTNAAHSNPRTVDEVFTDFNGRRTAILKALTTDREEFIQQCDPEKENLCLYGHPSGQWEVSLPAEEVPSELPEPALGINFAKDGMQEDDWISLVSVHSDSWLHAVAFYFGARFGFDKADRQRLFNMMNNLPTTYEIVSGAVKEPVKERSSANNRSNKVKPNPKGPPGKQSNEDDEYEDEEQEEDEEEQAFCGMCGENTDYAWILCDTCQTWFHMKCVKISLARADGMKQYKCPSCSSKRHLC